MVISSKHTVMPFVGYDGVYLSVTVATQDQSRSRQPILWTVHGSGGISSNDLLWQSEALQRGYTVVSVDHYSPRNIYKIDYSNTQSRGVWSLDLATDIILAWQKLSTVQHIIPFADLDNVKMVGFSSGATAAMYVTAQSDQAVWLRAVAALYPGIWPITDALLQIQAEKIKIYVGEDDDWTPPKHALTLQSLYPQLDVTVLPGVKHSFCKPGCGPYYQDIVCAADVPFPIPIPMQDVRDRAGEFARLLDGHPSVRIGVHAAYDATATRHVMDDFL